MNCPAMKRSNPEHAAWADLWPASAWELEVIWCERGDLNPHGFPRQILSSRRMKNQ